MRWRMDILLLGTFFTSVCGQMSTIDKYLDMAANNTNLNYTEISIETLRIDEETVESTTLTPENQNPESETEENDRTSEQEIPENGSSNDIQVLPTPEVTLPSSENTNSTVEEESQSSNEEQVARTSEELSGEVEGVQEVSGEVGVTQDSVITTTHGPVQGHLWNESPDIISFLDIPYGRISTLFQAPELPESWEETYHVDTHSKHCPQVQINEETAAAEVTGGTDCLTLSIFLMRETTNANVLFHIHDGSFTYGSGDPLIYGPEYLLSKGVILVLPNYRLGPLGFLCLQNETAQGNAALKDLTLALNWTKANIAAFGGNPDNIVVSGDGTSGALAGYLAISPASKNYVSKVIAESGSVVSHWAVDRDPITTATVLAQKIRTTYNEHTFNDSFFQDIEMDKLLLGAQGVHLRPCIENGPDPFISESPWYILQNQKFNTSFMIGSASFAGLHEALSHDANSISQLNEDFGHFIPDDLRFENGKDEMLEVANSIKTQYFGENEVNLNSEELALVYTDASYLSPVVRAARVLVEAGAAVYLYEFAFVGALNREHIALGSEVNGSVRGDIVGYLFSQGGQMAEEGSSEEHMVNVMTDLWSSFINNGTPSSSGVEWNQFESTSEDKEAWLCIGSGTQTRQGIHLDRLRLWTSIYEDYFVERNAGRSPSRHTILIVAAISLLGLFPRSMQVSR